MNYRQRIYENYESGISPKTVADFKPFAPARLKLIKDHFPADRNAKILDLGCGYGALLYFARQAGYKNITGVDLSEKQISSAASLGIDGAKRADINDVLQTTPLGSVDAIIALDVVEHFRKDELLSFLDRTFRVLRPGGRVIIQTVNGESPMGRSVFYGDFTHETCFTRQSISQILTAAGFVEINCYEDAPIPHGPISWFRCVLWRLIRLGLRFITAAETGDVGRGAILTRNFLTVALKS